MRIIIFLLAITFFLRACPKKKIISYGPYQAIRCGASNKDFDLDKFIFHKKNGYLYYYDPFIDDFKTINNRILLALIKMNNHLMHQIY